MTTNSQSTEGNQQLAAILAAGRQPQAAGDSQNANRPPIDPQAAAGNSGQRMQAILRSAAQPQVPQPTASRTRSGSPDDSENINPGRSQRLQNVLANGGSGGGGPNSSFARVVGESAGRIALLGGSAVALNTAMNGLANRTLRANENLGQFNGEIAVALGRARSREIERQIQIGETIGPEYARLNEAQQDYRDMMTDVQAPLQSAALDTYSALLEIRNATLGFFMPALTKIAESIEAIADKFLGGDDEEGESTVMSAKAFLSDVSDGKFDGFGTSYMNPGNRPLMKAADRQRIFGP